MSNQPLNNVPACTDDSGRGDGSYALKLVSSSILPEVLKVATELGVLEIIERAGPGATISSSQIALELGSKNPNASYLLDQMLCLLASNSILTCSGSHPRRLYGLAPSSKYFINNSNQDGGCLSSFLLMVQDRAIQDMWFHLKDVILEGGLPFERAHGMTAVSYVAKDPNFSEVFRGSMVEFNKIFVPKMLETYRGFEHLNNLIDVGGGDGSILNSIISKYPSIKGINYDLASVIERSPCYQGVEHVAGDMFQSIPEGQAIFMKWMLHNWSDEECVKILKNCHKALPEDGKVIVVEMVIPEAPEASVVVQSLFQMYMVMMSINSKGKERTEKELETLAKAAGFPRVEFFLVIAAFLLLRFINTRNIRSLC